MKAILLALAAFAATSATAATAPTNACEAYRAAPNPKETKHLDAYKGKLSKAELGMIQTAILAGDASASRTEKSALALFADAANEGSNGGGISYFSVELNGRTSTVVKATYFPGDNEYGALFSYHLNARGGADVRLIGLVEDGDITCLSFGE